MINGTISICNYWCSPKDVSNSINPGVDDIVITLDSGSIQMAGKIIAYGKTDCSDPLLTPADSGRVITVEDILHMEITNGFIVLPNEAPTLSAPLGKNVPNEAWYDLNGLSQTDDIRDFVSIINESQNTSGGFDRSTEFAYLLFKPYIISWFNVKNITLANKIKAFNARYKKLVSPDLMVNERNGAIISRKRSF